MTPLFLGIYINHLIFQPLKQSSNEDALIFVANDWFYGLLLEKFITIAVLLANEDNQLREQFLNLNNNGRPNLKLLCQIIFEIGHYFVLAWAIPYVFAYLLVPRIPGIENFVLVENFQKNIYPIFFIVTIMILVGRAQIQWFIRMINRLKERRYMVRNRLINRE